jgi:release factor glutamine methyltransferase
VTIAEALAEAERRIAAAGVETPRVDAELLVAHVLGLTRTQVYADRSQELDVGDLEPLLRRRERREPLAYVLGTWGFRRLALKTDDRALVPRPETEAVVGRALALLAGRPQPHVLDVGTGSGAIALAIADEHPGARVTGVDTSAGALELARENAALLGLEVTLRPGGLEAAADAHWDLVVSNPPYVDPQELPDLQPELHHEPREALAGVGFHEELARRARSTWLVLEAGDDQADRVARSLVDLGYDDVRVTPDLTGRDRVVEGRRG